MKKPIIDRTVVLLSIQRAMLGEVFYALRAMTVEWSSGKIKFWAYVNGDISEEDEKSLSCISAEVAADFGGETDIEYEIVRIDSPNKITDERTWVFYRRE